jgi:hypothetical protein
MSERLDRLTHQFYASFPEYRPQEIEAEPAPGWRTTSDMLELPVPAWLPGFDNILTTDGVHLVSSASGIGKSHLGLRWAAVASAAGQVVGYVPAEDEQQFRARLPALGVHWGADTIDRIRWWYQAPVLDGAEEHQRLLDRLQLDQDPPALLIIDTLSAAAGLYDEMKPEEVLHKIRLAAVLGNAAACAVVVLAHTGWNTTRVMGSSAIRRELRTSWVLEKPENADEGVLKLRQDKVRIGKPNPPQFFRIHDVRTEEGEGPVLVEGDSAAQLRNHAKRVAVEYYQQEMKWPSKRILAPLADVGETTALEALREVKAEMG